MGGRGGWEGEEDGRERRMGGRGGWEGEEDGRERVCSVLYADMVGTLIVAYNIRK